MPPRLSTSFFDRDVHTVARELLGATVLVAGVGGPIVEVEAYDKDDPASHSYRGPTGYNDVMFGPPGRAYVYQSYGIHWCLNFVCGGRRQAGAVLIRALQPTVGLDAMRARRGVVQDRLLCSGPGKLCQALAVTREHNGLALFRPPFLLRERTEAPEIVVGPRIGITKAVDNPWRYGVAGSHWLSRPFR